MNDKPIPDATNDTTRPTVTSDTVGTAAAPPLPFERDELLRALRSPSGLIDVVLAERDRFAATLFAGRNRFLLITILLCAAVVYALPFGAISDWQRPWAIPVLYLGALLICLPSLQVVSAYVGVRVGSGRYLALGLTFAAVAGLFAFGFFPIQWFLSATMLEAGSKIGPSDLQLVFLSLSFVAGVEYVMRCLAIGRRHRMVESGTLLVVGWQVLLAFITYRMASALGIA